MILLVTHSSSVHADLLEAALLQQGAQWLRLNTDRVLAEVCITARIVDGIVSGECRAGDRTVTLESIRAVWWFGVESPVLAPTLEEGEWSRWVQCETRSGISSILSSLPSFYVSHPARINLASDKILQLRFAHELGLRHPPTLLSANPEAIEQFAAANSQVVFKTLSHPTVHDGPQELVVYTSRVRRSDLADIASIRSCLNLLQAEIAKDVEIRATVVGDRVFAAEIHSQQSPRTEVDWRRYDIARTPHYPHTLPDAVEAACLAMIRRFNLQFGAIDLIKDCDGHYWFLELNPNGLWAWIEMLTGLEISLALAQLLVAGGAHYADFGRAE